MRTPCLVFLLSVFFFSLGAAPTAPPGQYSYDKKNIFQTRSHLRKLIKLQKRKNDLPGLEISHHELGNTYKKLKNYPTALHYYFEALEYSNRSPKPQDSRRGQIYLDLCEVFRVVNRQLLAARYLQKAMNFSIQYEKPQLRVRVLNAYSRLHYKSGNLEDALEYVNRSLEVEKELNCYVCGIQSLFRKALILKKMDAGDTMELLKKAAQKGMDSKNYENLLPVLNGFIEILIDRGELAQAAELLDKIDDIYAPYYSHYFFYYHLRALLSQKMDRMKEALFYYQQTAAALDRYFKEMGDHRLDPFREQTETIYAHMIEFYLELFRRNKQPGYVYRAIFYSEVKNAHVHDFHIRENVNHSHLETEKQKLENEYRWTLERFNEALKINGTGNRGILDNYEEKLQSLKKQKSELMELLLEIPIAFKQYRYNDLSIPRLRRKLKPGQIIVKYTLLEQHVYVFCISRDYVDFKRLPVTPGHLERLVKRLTEPLDDFTHGEVDYMHINYDLQLAHQLYNLLLHDTLIKRKNVQEILVVPDKGLFKIPFEALVTGFNNHEISPDVLFSEYRGADYLIERHATVYFLSLFHVQKRLRAASKKRYTVTAFGNPRINSTRTGNPDHDTIYRELPSSVDELLQIAGIFKKRERRFFSAKRFNKSNFNVYAPRSRIIHIATHFIANTDYPQYSALLFSARDSGNPFDLYYAHELFKLKLDTDLVVLSACESSEKHLLGLQGLRGMTASFKNAGARAMMVSMWPVDQYSSRLIPLFYKEYRNGKPPISALRTARLDLMKQTAPFNHSLKISFAHPFLWANYILYKFYY